MASAATSKKVDVINGFYMSMREKYTQDGAKIQYMLAEWDANKLSWADFRGKVLGATDPATAPEGTIRRTILDKYTDLGVDSEPNVGDNGVHASASPFEGLFERMNWVGAEIESDGFGKNAAVSQLDASSRQHLLGQLDGRRLHCVWLDEHESHVGVGVDGAGDTSDLLGLLDGLLTNERNAQAGLPVTPSNPDSRV
jgi:nucleoside diphosphate kinase